MVLVNIKQNLDGEIVMENKEKIYSGVLPASNALANLISYASDSEDNIAGEAKTQLTSYSYVLIYYFSHVLDAKKAKLIIKDAEKPAMNCPRERPPKPIKRRKKGKTQKSAVTVPAVKELVHPKRLTLLQKVVILKFISLKH